MEMKIENMDRATLDCFGCPCFVLKIDENGKPLYHLCNTEWHDRSGRGAEETYGQPATEVFGGRYGQAAYDRHVEVSISKSRLIYDLKLPLLNGDIRNVQTTLVPVLDSGGNVTHLVGISTDKTAESEAEELQRTMFAAQSEIEDFISLAAHDLRSPLRNIQNIADLLRAGFVDMGDGKLRLINLLERIAVKAGSVITEVLDHSQAVHSKQTVEVFSFEQLCSDIMVMLDPAQSHSMVATSAEIEADRLSLHMIIRNLIDNAIKYGGEGRTQINVNVISVSDTILQIEVTDNGPGFSDPSIAFIETGETSTESGYGLLAVKRLVKSRGGAIEARNNEAQAGSTIVFTIEGRLVGSPGVQVQPPPGLQPMTLPQSEFSGM